MLQKKFEISALKQTKNGTNMSLLLFRYFEDFVNATENIKMVIVLKRSPRKKITHLLISISSVNSPISFRYPVFIFYYKIIVITSMIMN